MPDTPTARLVTGHSAKLGKPPMVRKYMGGMVGERCYVVNCDDPDRALDAQNLPQEGHSWSAARPLLTCRECESNFVGGTSQAATGLGGACLVVARYATPSGGRLPVPAADLRYTFFAPGVSTFQSVYDARYPSDQFPILPPNASPIDDLYQQVVTPIMGGRGASTSIGATQANVVAYYSPNAFAGIMTRMVNLQRRQAVNKEAVNLPPLLGTLATYTMQPGQLKYVTFETPQDVINNGDLVRVVHVMEMAPDFDFRWKEEDQYGMAFGDELRTVLYLPESFAGLW